MKRAALMLATLLLGALAPGPAAAAGPQTGGLMLDWSGGLHPFGGFNVNTANAPYWPNWNIARSVVVRDDGSGGWTLDGYGGIHNWGGAAAINTPSYSGGQDIYLQFVVSSRDGGGLPDGRQGYLLRGDGTLFPWGGAPALTGNPVWTGASWVARGLDIHTNAQGVPDGGATLDLFGGVHPFGTYPALIQPPYTAGTVGHDGYGRLHSTGGALYAVQRLGRVIPLNGALNPSWTGYSDWGRMDVVKDIQIINGQGGTAAQPISAEAVEGYQAMIGHRGGATLDGWGGIHSFGGLDLNTAGSPYESGNDIYRSVVVREDGSGGWTLRGNGVIYAWGRAPAPSNANWGGWDIARQLVMTSRGPDGQLDGRQGYILDGYGGINPFGGAPSLGRPVYWQGWDIARGLDVHVNSQGTPDGGVVLDGWGGIHQFGNYPGIAVGAGYWPNRDVFLRLHSTMGAPYVVDRWGPVADLSNGNLHPYWSGYGDWGGWDILRDIALVGRLNPDQGAQPWSPDAAVALFNHIEVNQIPINPVRQAYPLDCEAAAMRAALSVKGVNASEAWELGYMGADTRAAVVDANGNVQQWGDPYATFVGNVNGSESHFTGYGVYHPPIAAIGRSTGRPIINQQNWDPTTLYLQVAAGNPVVIWTSNSFHSVGMRTWTAWDGARIPYALSEHAVTVIGVDGVNQTVTLNDVADGRMKTFSMSQFRDFFSSFGNMAVAVG